MPTARTNLLLRNDTVFGICEAIGQDLGFNPNWLRVALSAGLLWNPMAMILAYASLGVLVAVSRFAFPDRIEDASRVDAGHQPEANDSEQQALAA